MQFNIIIKTISEYIHKKFCFVHTNTFCKYRKKYAHRLACILLLACSNIICAAKLRSTNTHFTSITLAIVQALCILVTTLNAIFLILVVPVRQSLYFSSIFQITIFFWKTAYFLTSHPKQLL